ncbi:hypothetical protein RHMOL_Rhmol01G0172700 [Rhododendron molle]|uniref:Uncharacterized protein n=1 Tax=Rhododendron molle TaxID=49168 RepID=A0ACC0Q238_RHOML|nr:hypothetical protein RHMOL_Rhmol01G0172700 [Rhododendron molle]
MKAKEDRARAIEASAYKAKRERKERKEPLKDAEAEERSRAEVQWRRVTAMAKARVVARPDFLEEAYMPPTPHLFAPSGFAAYMPRRTKYKAELVLIDPKTHILNT